MAARALLAPATALPGCGRAGRWRLLPRLHGRAGLGARTSPASCATRAGAWIVALLVPVPAADAVDGVIEISQARALAGNVTTSDAAGFPVTLDAPGSYRLTGNLTVTDANSDAIEIASDDVSIDLNGFRIAGPATCSGAPGSISCSGGLGVGVRGTGARAWIHGGNVTGFPSGGVRLGDDARVSDLRSWSNGGNGIEVGDRSSVLYASASGNGAAGVFAGMDSNVIGSNASFNNTNGLHLGADSGFSNNVMNQNGGPAVAGGVSFDANVCGGAPMCTPCVPTGPEICDGMDNDCNGQIDEGNPGGGGACSTGLPGVCAAGTEECQGGSLVCVQDTQAGPEVCDGLDNNCDGSVDEGGVCGGGGPPGAGELVITEMMIDPSAVSDGFGEWFELRNLTGGALDLDGCTLSDLGTDSHVIAGPLVVLAGGTVVLGNNADFATNGGVVVQYEYASYNLANGGDEVILDCGGTQIDQVQYNAGFSSVGAARELSINHTTAILNDTLGNWCDAVVPFGSGDLGTPGQSNSCAL